VLLLQATRGCRSIGRHDSVERRGGIEQIRQRLGAQHSLGWSTEWRLRQYGRCIGEGLDQLERYRKLVAIDLLDEGVFLLAKQLQSIEAVLGTTAIAVAFGTNTNTTSQQRLVYTTPKRWLVARWLHWMAIIIDDYSFAIGIDARSVVDRGRRQ
jgi:hypothetical protein